VNGKTPSEFALPAVRAASVVEDECSDGVVETLVVLDDAVVPSTEFCGLVDSDVGGV
jgi:hypothetical protein